MNAVWFAKGGLLIIATGALNLLRVAYAGIAKGVRIVSVIANVVLVLPIVFMATLVPLRSNPQVVVDLLPTGLFTGLSLLRRNG